MTSTVTTAIAETQPISDFLDSNNKSTADDAEAASMSGNVLV